MAKTKKPVTLVPPIGGLQKKVALKQRPPYTTPKVKNVWPKDIFNGQQKIGRRPGLDLFNGSQLGSGNPINMLGSVDVVKTDGLTFWSDHFNDSVLGSQWTTASWASAAPSITLDGTVSNYDVDVAAVRSTFDDWDASSAFLVEMYISPILGQHFGRYRLFAYLDDTTPDMDDEGVMAELIMEGATGAYSGRLVDATGGFSTITNFTSGTDSFPAGGIFSILVTTTNVKAYWRGTQLCNVTVASHSGSRIGFGMYCTQANGICLVPWFRTQYYKSTYKSDPRKILCAASNGDFYRETYIGTLSQLSTNLSISTEKNIQCAERLQNLYIADSGQPGTSQTDGVISGTSLTSASVSDFTALNFNKYDYIVQIASGSSATAGNYTISAIASGSITLGSAPGNSSGVTFTIYRALKVYNPTADTLTILTESTGIVPHGGELVETYRDRLVTAIDHVWYMSRQGDPTDWDYGQTDAQRAVAGSNSEAGRIGQRIKSMLAHRDDYLLFWCDNSFWRLRGDPTYGGQIDAISNHIGIVDKYAKCITPENNVLWLSRDGLYVLSSLEGASPQSLSRETMPRELINIDSKLYIVTMGYDIKYRGVHIYLTPRDGGIAKHWFYDWENKSFWEIGIPENHQPHSMFEYISQDLFFSNVLFGSKDGYIRYFDDSFVKDGNNAITDYIYYGPFFGWDEGLSGLIAELEGILPINSGDIKWSIIVGNSHDQCLNNGTTMLTGVWTLEGLNIKTRPRIKGNAWLLKIESNQANNPWALEAINVVLEQAGLKRYI